MPLEHSCRLVTGDQLDAIVDDLKNIQRSGLEKSFKVGQVVFERFYSGSIEAWRDRRRGKDHSLRALADRPGCPLSKSALHQAVSVYVASQSLASVESLKYVGPSHILAVLGLNLSDRERFLRRAGEQSWSVRELRREVARYLQAIAGPVAGARRLPRQISGRLRQNADNLLALASRLDRMSLPAGRAAELEAALDQLHQAEARMALAVKDAWERRGAHRAEHPDDGDDLTVGEA